MHNKIRVATQTERSDRAVSVGATPVWLHRLCCSVNGVPALIGIALLFASPALLSALTYDRAAILAGQAWRLWTGHLTHFSLQHLLVDVGVLALLIVLLQREAGAIFTSLTWLCGMPLLSLGLLVLVPGLSEYRGASGLDVMLAVALGMRVWQSGSSRMGLLLLGLCLLVKIGLEVRGMGSALGDLPSGIRLVWEAHALGAVIGALLAWGGTCVGSSGARIFRSFLRQAQDKL